MPYMARQADGGAWEDDGITKGASRENSRQPFVPDGSRVFDEIDRLAVNGDGVGNMISNKAQVDFYRVAPPAGYTKGLVRRKARRHGGRQHRAGNTGEGLLPLSAGPSRTSPPRMTLARITNMTPKILPALESTMARSGRREVRGSRRPCIGSTSLWT